MKQRTFAEHIPLLTQFAARVDALSPEAWQRIEAHCRPLAGSSPAALYRRAETVTTAYDVFGTLAPLPAVARVIPALSRATVVGINVGLEMVTSAIPSLHEKPWTRRTTTGRTEHDACIDAMNTIEQALARYATTRGVAVIPSVTAAMRAAVQAILRHDQLTPATFAAAYQWVEPEIPYALIDPPAAAAT